MAQGILVIGLGKSGLSAALLAKRKGLPVFVTERARTAGNESAFVTLDAHSIPYECENTDKFFAQCDTAVISPGIDPRSEYIRSVAAHMTIISELEFAWRQMKPHQKIIGITGTNGKSTTTTLVYELFRSQGLSAALTGNIGFPLCDYADKDYEYFICEISSYQLEAIVSLRCESALITNITPDHLNRYDDGFTGYTAAKRRIFENQNADDILVLNAENVPTQECANGAKSKIYMFHKTEPVAQGAYVMGDMIVMRESSKLHEIVRLHEVRLPGAHNLENILAAVALTWRYVTNIDALREVLRTFNGIEHRLEYVTVINGVHFVNDSKGTNVDSTEKALVSYPTTKIVAILGGDAAKKSDFSPLIPLIHAHCRSVVLIGETKPVMKALCDKDDITYTEAVTMADAVHLAFKAAQQGDVVVLSPACASFDMFDNFEHRGTVFKEEVMKLKEEHGS